MSASGFVSCHQWIFPDAPPPCAPSVELYAAAGGTALVQHLSAAIERRGAQAIDAAPGLRWKGGVPGSLRLYQARPVCVDQNTAATLMTTLDYESCKDFVTRRAPFFVYDALYPIDGALPLDDPLHTVLCVEVRVDERCPTGEYEGELVVGGKSWDLRLHVRGAAASQEFCFFNFTCFENIAKDHGLSLYGPDYWPMFAAYARMQKHLRCTHIMAPSALPLREGGSIVSFDYGPTLRAVETALAEGIDKIIIAPVAHWKAWNDSSYLLNWDESLDTQGLEAYMLLKLYCQGLWRMILDKGWQRHICHSIADEPQTFNDCAYRAMSAIFRKFLPCVQIVEAVETSSLGGAVDVWVPKQHSYEQSKETFDALKKSGEIFWYYSCAFPANAWMNRSMDLPLAVSKALPWMGFYHGFSGYLHWGLNFYIGDNVFEKACCPHKGALLPAGDAHILYPGERGPLPSIRALLQMQGIEDVALLSRAEALHPGEAKKLVADLCSSFSRYEKDAGAWDSARAALFSML